jgi:hypothetical protein
MNKPFIKTLDTTITELAEAVKLVKVGQTANVIIQNTMKQLTIQPSDKVYYNVAGIYVGRNGFDFKVIETLTYLDDTVAFSR